MNMNMNMTSIVKQKVRSRRRTPLVLLAETIVTLFLVLLAETIITLFCVCFFEDIFVVKLS